MYASSRFFSDMQKRKKGYKKVGKRRSKTNCYISSLFLTLKMYLTVIEQQKLCSRVISVICRVISVICSVISVICSHLIVDNHCHIGNRPIWHHAISVSGGKFVAISGLVISAGSGIVLISAGKQWLIFLSLTAGGEPGTKVISSDSRGFIVTVKVGISKVGKAWKKM